MDTDGSTEPPFIEVCAAVIQQHGNLLLALRPDGSHLQGHWEFPGGKVHEGETLEACIRREIREELGVGVDGTDFLRTVEHHYPEKSIRLHFLACSIPDEVVPLPLQHETIGWFPPAAAASLNLAPADHIFLDWFATVNAGNKK